MGNFLIARVTFSISRGTVLNVIGSLVNETWLTFLYFHIPMWTYSIFSSRKVLYVLEFNIGIAIDFFVLLVVITYWRWRTLVRIIRNVYVQQGTDPEYEEWEQTEYCNYIKFNAVCTGSRWYYWFLFISTVLCLENSRIFPKGEMPFT